MAHYIKKRNVEMTESSLEIMETRRKRMRSLKNWSERGEREERTEAVSTQNYMSSESESKDKIKTFFYT
jgi:hypothetical protein